MILVRWLSALNLSFIFARLLMLSRRSRYFHAPFGPAVEQFSVSNLIIICNNLLYALSGVQSGLVMKISSLSDELITFSVQDCERTCQ